MILIKKCRRDIKKSPDPKELIMIIKKSRRSKVEVKKSNREKLRGRRDQKSEKCRRNLDIDLDKKVLGLGLLKIRA